jgi:hypothetical protein
MKPTLTGQVCIQNAAEYETALLCVERLMEVAEDSEMDPLDPLLAMLVDAIQTWEAKDRKLAAWDDFFINEEPDVTAEVLTEEQKLEQLKASFAAADAEEKNGELIDGEAFFQQLDESDEKAVSISHVYKQKIDALVGGIDVDLDARLPIEIEQDPKIPTVKTREALKESEDIRELERISSIDDTLGLDGLDARAAARQEIIAAAKRNGIILTLLEGNDIIELLARVRTWFACEEEMLNWYLHEPLVAFGDLTPTEVIKRHGDKGFRELLEYITAKELGGFE